MNYFLIKLKTITMKKSALLFSVIFFAALFMSSCAHRNITIEKRHYGNGYYVHTTGKIHHDKTVKSETAIAIQENQTTEEKAEIVSNKKEEAAPVVAISSASSEKKTAKTKHATTKEAIAEPIRVIEKNSTETAATKSVQQVSKTKSVPAADDVDLVLIIILCFLLPPLAVYLSEGLTTNFWIDLILTLLLFIPGIIFALIVCL